MTKLTKFLPPALMTLAIAGCRPTAPSFEPKIIAGMKPYAVVKGPDLARDWYFYYQLKEPAAKVLDQAKEELTRPLGWQMQEGFGFTKYRGHKGDDWFQVSIKQGTWKKRADGYCDLLDTETGVGVLIIQGIPSL